MSDDVEVKFGAATGDIEGGIDRVTSHIGEMSMMAEHAEELFKYLGERMLEVFALHEITDFIGKLSELGERLNDAVLVTGLSSDEVQGLSYAYEQAGGSASRAAMLIARFERYVEEAAGGNNQYTESFKKLNISLDDLRHMSIDALLQKTAEGFRNIKDPIDRAAVATEFGERDFIKFLAAIEKTPNATQEAKAHLAELDDLLSGDTIKALTNTHEKLVDFAHAAEGAGVKAMITFKGSIDGVIEDFTQAVKVLGDVAVIIGDLADELEIDLIKALTAAETKVMDWAAEFENAAKHTEIQWQEVERIVKDSATGAWSDIAKAEEEAQRRMAAADSDLQASLKADKEAYEDVNKAALDYVMKRENVLKTGVLGNEGEGKANRTGLNAPKNTANKEMEDFRAMIEYKEDLAKGNYKVLLDLQQQLVDESEKLYGKDSAQYYSALKRKLDLQREADKAATADYDKFFKSMQQGMDQMVTGVLRGTQTWQQALARMFDDLAIKFVEKMVIEPKLKYLQGLFDQQIANDAKNAHILASDQATSSASAGFHAASALAKISADAAEAYAGVFAWAAPMMGPFAAVPAAAAYALVMAKDALVGSFDTGTSYVPRTGLAMVHEGEAIIPASQNTGGGGVTLNVSALDAKSFLTFVNNPSIMRMLAKNIGGYMASNPSTRGAY